MKNSPIITKVEYVHFSHVLDQLGTDYNGFNMVHVPGGKYKQSGTVARIHTDRGHIGEYPHANGLAQTEIRALSRYLIGKDALAREHLTCGTGGFRVVHTVQYCREFSSI